LQQNYILRPKNGGELVKKTLLFLCLLTLCNLALSAQTVRSSRIVHTTEKSAIHVPPQETPAGLKKIYSNLGKSKTYLYVDTGGWAEAGPNSSAGFTQFVGMPFTPKSSSHVSQVGVAVEYISGANQVNLSIYGDAGGIPGTLLAGPVTVTNLPSFGTCCALAAADFPSVPVTGAAQYWIVADTPLTGTGSDFNGAWDMVVTVVPQGFDNGSGWYGANGLQEAAGEVLGTIP
jgi:hypothetical protein